MITWHNLILQFAFWTTITISHELKTSSQCAKAKAHPFVKLHCNHRELIKIHRAFHGRHVREGDSGCSRVPDDCNEDKLNTNIYDWPDHCMGRQHCVQSVKQSWMASCGNYSDYLQVHYACIPDAEVINMCKRETYKMKEGYLRSPSYPEYYPPSQDCSCTLVGHKKSNIFVSFYDLAMETHQDGRCADWLLMETNITDSDNVDGSTNNNKKKKLWSDMSCGHIVQDRKNITVKSNRVHLHLHTDKHDNRTQAFSFNTKRHLKGFWVYFTSDPPGTVILKCRPSSPHIPEQFRVHHTSLPKLLNASPPTTNVIDVENAGAIKRQTLSVLSVTVVSIVIHLCLV